MTDIKQKKENVKMHLKDLRQNLKKMHLEVTEELILPKPDDIKELMNKMDKLLKLIESKYTDVDYKELLLNIDRGVWN